MSRPFRIATAVLAAVAVVVVAAFASTATGAGSTTVKTSAAGSLGRILVNGKGVTLYLFEKDAKNKSRCSGSCATVWPPLIAKGHLRASGGVRGSHLGSIKRSDGKRQVTYFGHPLYTYVGDGGKAGRHAGQGLDQFGAEWYVLRTNGKKVD
jgi:predicted lipoprotein with Yx(FWY)xxD motif